LDIEVAATTPLAGRLGFIALMKMMIGEDADR
jgi:hypothetical protein